MSYPLLTFFTLSAPIRVLWDFPTLPPRLSPRVAALATAFFLAAGPHVSHSLVGVFHGLSVLQCERSLHHGGRLYSGVRVLRRNLCAAGLRVVGDSSRHGR